MDAMRRILQAHDADFAERTAIVASIGKLERKGTIEATAEVVVDALMKLPAIDLAAVFACDGPGLEIWPWRDRRVSPSDRVTSSPRRALGTCSTA